MTIVTILLVSWLLLVIANMRRRIRELEQNVTGIVDIIVRQETSKPLPDRETVEIFLSQN